MPPAGSRPWLPKIAAAAREVPGPGGRHRLLRRRHPQPDAARDRGRGDRRDPPRLVARARRRDHARGQSHLGRGRPVPRLPRRRGEPALHGRPGPERRRPQGARPHARHRRGGARLRGGAGDLPAGELRPHLCPSGPDAGRLAGRAGAGAGAGDRPPLALPAHHRGGDALRRARRTRQAPRPAGAGGGGRHVPRHGGDLRRGGVPGLRESPTTPGRGPRAGTTSSTGATGTMSAWVPERTDG